MNNDRDDGVDIGYARLLACLFELCEVERYIILLQVIVPSMQDLNVIVSTTSFSSSADASILDNDSDLKKIFSILRCLETIFSCLDFSCDTESMRNVIYFLNQQLEPTVNSLMILIAADYNEAGDIELTEKIVISGLKLLSLLFPIKEFQMLAVKRDLVDSLVEITASNEKFLVNSMNCLRLAIEYGRIYTN